MTLQDELDKIFGKGFSTKLENGSEGLDTAIGDLIESVDSSKIDDFWHMNKYTTREYHWGHIITYNIAGASKEDVIIKKRDGMIDIHIKGSELFKELKDKLWIPVGVDADKVSVKYENGLLNISLPRVVGGSNEDIEIIVD
jgi:HSP20 family molecular chaperone IbpA